jgi:hypothetical protein
VGAVVCGHEHGDHGGFHGFTILSERAITIGLEQSGMAKPVSRPASRAQVFW